MPKLLHKKDKRQNDVDNTLSSSVAMSNSISSSHISPGKVSSSTTRNRSNSSLVHRSRSNSMRKSKTLTQKSQNQVSLSSSNFLPDETGSSNMDTPNRRSLVASNDEINLNMDPNNNRAASRSGPERSSSTGFFSSILNVAHNAANIISGSVDENNLSKEDREKEHSFSTKLESLLKPVKSERNSLLSVSDSAQQNDSTQDESKNDEQPKVSSPLSASNVHFDSVRESPLNSLGSGDLSLDNFDKKNSLTRNSSLKKLDSINKRLKITSSHSNENLGDIRRSLSPGIVNKRLPVTNQLLVSGNDETKRIHKMSVGSNSVERDKSLSSGPKKSMEDEENDEFGSESEINDDLDNEDLGTMIDYSNIKFATSKRNKDFHQVFKKIPKSENLIDDFSCALSKDILVQGRMYLSDHFICFNSNILGWVTNLIIPLQEVIQIEKKSTAVLFPNGMIIRTLHHKYVFATFLSRDSTFNLITNVWHRVLIETSDVDPTKLVRESAKKRRRGESNPTVSKSASREGNTDESSNITDDEDNNSLTSFSLNMDDNTDNVDVGYMTEDGSFNGDESQLNNFLINKTSSRDDIVETALSSDNPTFNGLPAVGPITHPSTEVDYNKQANEVFIADEIIRAPLGVVYLLLFGPDTSKYIRILKNQKNFDITESDITELSMKSKERHYSYIKPLGGAIGPKQTKCIIADMLLDYQIDHHILVEQTTSTPDVPSGNSFKVRTKIFLTWASNNCTRIYVITTIDWSSKSWIKGAIEKGSIDGQKESMKLMIDSLNEFVTQGGGAAAKIAPKKKTKRKKSLGARKPAPAQGERLEVPPTVTEKSIYEQFIQLVESIGRLVPIPYLNDLVVGSLILFTGLLISTMCHNMLLRKQYSQLPILPNNEIVSNIIINNHKYSIIPSIDSAFANQKFRFENEINLWNWIQDRSENNLNVVSDENYLKEYSNQEVKEILKLTQMKLDEMNRRIKH